MAEKRYKICTRCIMDTSDPNIQFNNQWFCNHCTTTIAKLQKPPLSSSGTEKEKLLNEIVLKIKSSKKRGKYDCIIGVSGWADSSYVAYKVKELWLKPLAIHLDNGRNSELSVKNIELLLRKLDIDLYTHVLDRTSFRDLQLSFLKAWVPDLEIPTDHAIISVLFDLASKYNIKYIITGHNYATESILPTARSQWHFDRKYIQGLQNLFGKEKLRNFPHMNLINIAYQQFLKKIRMVNILDYMDYDKKTIVKQLEEEFWWRNYATKHGESTYTHFIQSYILPNKFWFDKRRAHLSSLVCAWQLSREEALQKIDEPVFTSEKDIQEIKEYVCDKFNISIDELEKLMQLPNKSYFDYPCYENNLIYTFAKKMYHKFIKHL